MSDVPPDDSNNPEQQPRRSTTWRDRYEAARARGVALDPTSEPVEGVTAYPTAYAADHLLITRLGDIDGLLTALREAAADFGWGIRLQTMDGKPTDLAPALDRARRARSELDLPTIYRIAIVPDPRPDRDDQPVPPIDAWRLLQRTRARARAAGSDLSLLDGISLDHVLSVDPVGGKTNPVGGKTNPVGGKTNPVGGKTNPFGSINGTGAESYLWPGSGGRQVVDFIGVAPARTTPLSRKGRRPVVAVLDTGCGDHPWLPDDVVTRYPTVEGNTIGIAEPVADPEVIGDIAGAYDGALDESAGHGTFIAGIVRQVSPEADIVAVRVADSQGTVLEGDFMLAVRSLVKWIALGPENGGGNVDVINLSLGYYHESPEDGLFDRTLNEFLVVARRRGCAVVCSAGNDATDRPSFPAALWAWPDAEFTVEDPDDAAPHISVGALNPNGTTALFSNMGPWVGTYAPGAAVVSAHPRFNGGTQPGTRDDRDGMRRETIDPDDFGGGFAIWSGTSFAAPYVAGLLARELSAPLMGGKAVDATERVKLLRRAQGSAYAELARRSPITIN